MTTQLTAFQVLLHRMVHQKLQWLDYYGQGDTSRASRACYVFADLIILTPAGDTPDEYLTELHDATLSTCRTNGEAQLPLCIDTLGNLFNNARQLYVAHFHRDPIRTLPRDHPRFPWEHLLDQPQDPAAIDVRALTEPLSPPPSAERDTSATPPPWVMPATLVGFFVMASVFILIGLNQ